MPKKETHQANGLENGGVHLMPIEQYLSNGLVVQDVLTLTDLKAKIGEKKPINIMMGQTFDDGQPVDMMKYALFIMGLCDVLKAQGIDASANWLIADHFITDINQEGEASKVKKLVEKRVNYLQQINRTYGGNIGIVLSSELSQQPRYQQNLDALIQEADSNDDFRRKVLEAVPEDRRGNPNAFRYPLEELATIQTMGADIKVGPPYERYYDEPAREIAGAVGFNKYVAIHLTRGFPFGNPEITEETTIKNIDEFGILPYKIASKGLGNFRIDTVVDGMEKVTELVMATRTVRPIIDLIAITDQARERISGALNPDFILDSLKRKDLEQLALSGDVQQGSSLFDSLRAFALRNYREYIHNPLNKINN